MSKTILYFTDSSGFGGAEQALLTLIAGLPRDRWQPMLAHHDDPGLTPFLAAARQLEVRLLPVPRLPDGKLGAGRVPQLVRQLRGIDPAVFHAHLTWPLACKFGLVAAVLARVPAVVATEHLFVELPYDRSMSLQQRLMAWGVDRYIAVSQHVARRLRQTFGFPARKVEVIPNGIALERVPRALQEGLPASLLGGGTTRPIILTPARLDRQKGHRFLVAAAADVPEALFVFAGDGPERAALEAQVAALGLEGRVLFLGQRSDVPALLARCDMLVLPSLFEGLPLAVLEAMAAGKPVVATAIGGTSEAVTDHQTGLLVPPADACALGQAIQKLLREPLLAHRMGEAGRQQVAAQFSAAQMAQRTVNLYERLLATQGGHGARH